MNSKKVDNDGPNSKKKKKELSEEERKAVCYELLSSVIDKKLPKGHTVL